MDIIVRDATSNDAGTVVQLLREHAALDGAHTAINETYVTHYLSSPTSQILIAEANGRAIGLLSFSVRADLYHAGPVCFIEELVVGEPCRRGGVGHALMTELLPRMAAMQARELAVAVMPANTEAAAFYRSHGLAEEALLLERHLLPGDPAVQG
jgi:ribosomal protein S18 acetylase RimI-like enzyme